MLIGSVRRLRQQSRKQATQIRSTAGADYAIEIFGGEAALFRWDGSRSYAACGRSTCHEPPCSRTRAGITINISSAELWNTRALRFNVLAFSGITIDPATSDLDFTNAVADIAPAAGAGLYQYELEITPPTLVVKSFKPTPKAPTAGRAFTLRLVAARSDTGAVVQNCRVTCVGRIGNARLKAQVQRVQGGAATCTWTFPATAKGKTFRGSVTVTFEGLKASQAHSGKVRWHRRPCDASRFSFLSSLSSQSPERPLAPSIARRAASSSTRWTKVRPAPDLAGRRARSTASESS